MNKRLIFVLAISLNGAGTAVFAQEPVVEAQAGAPAIPKVAFLDEALALTSSQFELWAASEGSAISTALQRKAVSRELVKKRLDFLEQAVLERYKNNVVTSDAAVQSVINAWMGFDRPAIAGQKKPRTETNRFIDALLPQLKSQPSTAAMLHQRKGIALELEGAFDAAAAEHSLAIKLLKPVHLEIDLAQITSTVMMGHVWMRAGDRTKAADAYQEALSYPFNLTAYDDQMFRKFWDLHIQAGKGILEARRGDYEALKNTSFYPSAMAELGIRLRQYTAEAEESLLRKQRLDQARDAAAREKQPVVVPPAEPAIAAPQP